MSIFIKDGIYCVIHKDSCEVLEQFIQRCYIILNEHPMTEKEFKKAEILSHIMINQKYLGCKYYNK